ncbi:alpha-galactosidase A precursor [Aureobasidium pullulans]|uniref:Alpha-galactosidase A n=1 Tax=Aureobasidium pullulans TaxID=5580 RepID=A0A4S9VWM2_AURPU|nr:alpha-galactosidase A precursor [Aureobasidium pullulans]THZ43973.1 alpha-galactosidase A precursor [Aureobasidium pullulans]THZ57009.1 alpha-galactosidase A precursor [Aureobasidium pullulans]
MVQRILIDSRHIKYITVDPGVYDIDTMCFEPYLIPALPPLPELPMEDWNSAHISHHPSDGKPHFSRVTNDPLPSIAQTWHPARVEFLDCQLGDQLRSNVHEATCSKFEGKVVVKLARFPWEIWQLDYETQAYQWIQGHGIAPAFLAHLTEEGRIIGFVMKHIANARHAEPEDLPLCQETLRRLHRLGIKHGDVNKHNMLVASTLEHVRGNKIHQGPCLPKLYIQRWLRIPNPHNGPVGPSVSGTQLSCGTSLVRGSGAQLPF